MFSVDKSLNYGRDQIKSFLSKDMQIKSILDIGAGKGDDLLIYKNFFNPKKMYSIELYEPNIQILQSLGIENFKINPENQRIPLDGEYIDLISTNQFLEHTKEIFYIFHEITRVLKKDGYLVISIPNLASLHNRLLLSLGRQPTSIKINSAHVRGFTYHGFLSFLEEIYPKGYELLGLKGANFYPFSPFIAKKLAYLFPKSSWGMVFLFKKMKEYNNEFICHPQEKNYETNFYYG